MSDNAEVKMLVDWCYVQLGKTGNGNFTHIAQLIEALVKQRDDLMHEGGGVNSKKMDALLKAEATAAEMRRLQELYNLKQNLTAEVVKWTHAFDKMQERALAKEAEVVRLHKAISEIADHDLSTESDESITYSDCGADTLIEIAREAVQPEIELISVPRIMNWEEPELISVPRIMKREGE